MCFVWLYETASMGMQVLTMNLGCGGTGRPCEQCQGMIVVFGFFFFLIGKEAPSSSIES